MKKLGILFLSGLTIFSVTAKDVSQKAKVMLGKVTPNTITYKAENGWLYSKNELGHLAKGDLAKGKVASVSASRKPANANPIPALKAFHKDLEARGIKLIIVPVPPKLAAAPCGGLKTGDAMAYLRPFYQEMRAQGLTVLDISEQFKSNADIYYCRTDAHWSPAGITLTVDMLSKLIPFRGNKTFTVKKESKKVSGDLAKSLKPSAPETEEIVLHTVTGNAIAENSPILLLGDSHTLIFSSGADMLATNAGFAETLAAKLKTPIDRIGVRGSAATAVRINLFRKATRNKAYLKNKKYVIYCFSCREFTEASSGWVRVPVARK